MGSWTLFYNNGALQSFLEVFNVPVNSLQIAIFTKAFSFFT